VNLKTNSPPVEA